MSISIDKLKLTWKGQWQRETRYLKNDVVQWDGRSYLCIEDNPDEIAITTNPAVGMYTYMVRPQELVVKGIRPDDSKYWKLILQSTDEISSWNMWDMYEPGDMCKAHRNIYMCVKRTRIHNTWVEENDYWVKILEMQSARAGRNEVIAYSNRAPLGWKYNMGCNNIASQRAGGYSLLGICSDGNAMLSGAEHDYGKGARGWENNQYGRSRHSYSGFTFTDWLKSSDNEDWNENAYKKTDDFIGLVTPDGKTPKIIQICSGSDANLYLMNNGEVYAAGYNGHGQLGNSETTNRDFSVRVSANDTRDWLGNPIQRTFNQTKIVKVTISSMGYARTGSSCGALGEDGSVWVWGYNGTRCLGLGSQDVNSNVDYGGATSAQDEELNTVTVPATSGGFRTGSQYRPVRLPQSYFDGNKIVDLWNWGCDYACWHALDNKGNLWAWGADVSSALGLGGSNTQTHYRYVPTKVPMDWKVYGGIKKIMHKADIDGEARMVSMVLTNDGKLFVAGDFTGYGIPLGTHGDALGSFSGIFVECGTVLQGTIDEFWLGGAEQAYTIAKQKDTGYTYIADGGGETNSGHRESMLGIAHGYSQGSQMGLDEFQHLPGIMWVKHVTGPNGYRQDSANWDVQYQNPMILDGESNFWSGGYNFKGYASLGYENSENMQDIQWYQGYFSPEQYSEQIFNPYHPRLILIPNGTKITDAQLFGSGYYGMMGYTDSRGKYLFAGFNNTDGYHCRQYHIWSYFYRIYYGNTGDSYHEYLMHSGPTD